MKQFRDYIKVNEISKTKVYRYIRTIFLIGLGLFTGWLFFHSPGKGLPETQQQVDSHEHQGVSAQEEIWTCSMHPQIRMHEPGKCPICAMDLIPLMQGGVTQDPTAIQLSAEAIALAHVQTSVVSKNQSAREIRLYGTVQPDERLLQSQPAHIPGRIEELDVNFTGETVKKGQILAKIYSPELIKAQQDLLEAMKMKDIQPAILEAARERLRQWKLTPDQIAAIENSGEITTEFPVLAGTSGIVMARRINVGDYVNRGTTLFDIADLSKLWVLFDAYEQDLPFIRTGDKITYTLQAMPGKTYKATVKFVDPFVDPATRVAKIRVELPNHNGQLKPEMFAAGVIQAHTDQFKNNLVIPRSAVMWTGKRSVVYVRLADEEEPTFKLREITLGPRLGNSYVVVEGLAEGEEIVTEGTFSVDAAAQLEGKPSMMSVEPASAIEKVEIASTVVCDMCRETIEKGLVKEKGVKGVNVDLDTKVVSVSFDPAKTNSKKIRKAISQLGYGADDVLADKVVYENLPACCKIE
ncbi:MAG: efflux RND transporter periplasmic adaptor subunit [Bacteroidales bacterium]|nr:efflux RND transporter periplasmic adaptor subunit [Bacteroidales bacterium]